METAELKTTAEPNVNAKVWYEERYIQWMTMWLSETPSRGSSPCSLPYASAFPLSFSILVLLFNKIIIFKRSQELCLLRLLSMDWLFFISILFCLPILFIKWLLKINILKSKWLYFSIFGWTNYSIENIFR